MTKRIISILLLIALLFTGCSEPADTASEEGTDVNTEIYDLPDESVPILSDNANTNASEDVEADAPIEIISDETSSVTEANSTETEQTSTDESDPSTDEPESATSAEVIETIDAESTSTAQSNTEPTETTQMQSVDSRIYEDYLAALTVMALSLEYFDFIPMGVFSSEKVTFDRKFDSKGIYAMFESEGNTLIAKVYPLQGERNETGTLDIYATELGFAAFEIVDSIPDGYTEIEMDVYAELLSKLTGVSTYRR